MANPLKNGDAKLQGLRHLLSKCYCQPVAEYDGDLRLLAHIPRWMEVFLFSSLRRWRQVRITRPQI